MLSSLLLSVHLRLVLVLLVAGNSPLRSIDITGAGLVHRRGESRIPLLRDRDGAEVAKLETKSICPRRLAAPTQRAVLSDLTDLLRANGHLLRNLRSGEPVAENLPVAVDVLLSGVLA